MVSGVFQPKKLRRNGVIVMMGSILLVVAVTVYYEVYTAIPWTSYADLTIDAEAKNWWRAMSDKWVSHEEATANYEDESPAWRSNYTAQIWKPEYKGRVNVHAFDDWCGGSTAELRRNLHYPLYPHVRTTVQKLSLSLTRTNYGLRIFGYLHPYADGDFVFAISSCDNSDLWLSTDDSPLNLNLEAYVGKTGTEWTAPGEFDKYASQTSRPVRLSAEKRYFFEVILKQNNDGIDHVEVAWKTKDDDFMVIQSEHISLYFDEYHLLIGDIDHVPQTVASHQFTKLGSAAVDMLKEGTRDALYKVSLVKGNLLEGVLPDCAYQPSYTIKGYPLARYQGLQFVHMSYVYPNDYTRLTHMEPENSCFYPKNIKTYMSMETPESMEKIRIGRDVKSISVKEDQDSDQLYTPRLPDYGQEIEDYAPKNRRKLFSAHMQEENSNLNSSYTRLRIDKLPKRQGGDSVPLPRPHPSQKKVKSVKTTVTPGQKARPMPVGRGQHKAKGRPAVPSEQLLSRRRNIQGSHEIKILRRKGSELHFLESDTPLAEKRTMQQRQENREVFNAIPSKNTGSLIRLYKRDLHNRRPLGETENAPPQHKDINFDTGASWRQTVQVSPIDIQSQRTDAIDLRCNCTGNLLLPSSDVMPVVMAFMDKLNEKHNGQFALLHVLNVVKRVDKSKGSRYLLELMLTNASGEKLRLSHYVYVPLKKPEAVLCNPVGMRWNPEATVHIIVPVKNQARWVHALIADMERLYKETGDTNVNLIIADFDSSDMDVKKALEKSSLPRYDYVKLNGNFERASGLQTGIELIKDEHSIVFLCDLHIYFPNSLIDTIRKHCVEGYMVFAPIVMRLNCGGTPWDAKGYWEVNGFGLIGLYKSDLMAVGGMNTREYKDRWGGEDWELLDRILKSGLEVDRIYLRNFYHHFHSKRGMWQQSNGR